MLAALCACSPATASKGSTIVGTGTELPGNPSAGAQIFRANCASCHGPTGVEGGVLGPSLHRERERMDFSTIASWIEDPEPPMPHLYPKPLSLQEVRDVASYVATL